ncbi:MAG: hypothetical protein AB8C40_01415 [Gammaproteobacteria bacterium]
MSNNTHDLTRKLKGLQILVTLNLFFAPSAYAYVDPGSGSVIVTTVLGLIAAIGYTCRKYFYKAKKLFTKNNASESEQHQTNKNDD